MLEREESKRSETVGKVRLRASIILPKLHLPAEARGQRDAQDGDAEKKRRTLLSLSLSFAERGKFRSRISRGILKLRRAAVGQVHGKCRRETRQGRWRR